MNFESARLTVYALWEMGRYELASSVFGFNSVRNRLAKRKTASRPANPGQTDRICAAVNLAACFWFKPVRCLQKSVVTARLLRKGGVDARVVIGYRQAPFFSHAWVEVNGKVVNDSPACKEQLSLLSVI